MFELHLAVAIHAHIQGKARFIYVFYELFTLRKEEMAKHTRYEIPVVLGSINEETTFYAIHVRYEHNDRSESLRQV